MALAFKLNVPCNPNIHQPWKIVNLQYKILFDQSKITSKLLLNVLEDKHLVLGVSSHVLLTLLRFPSFSTRRKSFIYRSIHFQYKLWGGVGGEVCFFCNKNCLTLMNGIKAFNYFNWCFGETTSNISRFATLV